MGTRDLGIADGRREARNASHDRGQALAATAVSRVVRTAAVERWLLDVLALLLAAALIATGAVWGLASVSRSTSLRGAAVSGSTLDGSAGDGGATTGLDHPYCCPQLR